LGAGAGRNTPRYSGFQEVTLVDYSRTQLEQARARLGDSPRYRYIAADIYHLPFAPASFDGATMIRTLHHMAQPRQALDQVRAALASGSIFILEFANKLNFKAMLRFSLGKQPWNPFSPEPVEFAPLNYDFHPATVRAWLQGSGFSIERQLTVSHFRIGLLKRLLPTRLLVWMDSAAQLSGDLWQFSPSVFARCRVNGQPQALEDVLTFRCPACAYSPLPDDTAEIVCPGCGRSFPVKDGIYDFRLDPPAE
jgi:SAM-dependent methyltransferase